MEPKIDQATEAVIEQIIDSAVHYRILPLQGSDWERVLPMLRAVPGLLEACKILIEYRRLAGPLGFQLEKADCYIEQIEAVIAKAEPDPLDSALDACDGEIELVDP